MFKKITEANSEKFINWVLDNKKSRLFKLGIQSNKYKKIKLQTFKASSFLFGKKSKQKINIDGLGEIKIPFFSFGNISSVHMWDIEDLFLFSYYKKNQNLYKQAYDLGANVGLHSVIMSKCGYKKILSYEPDPKHIKQLKINFKENKIKKVKLNKKAIFISQGSVIFNRILGNTQSSHIINAKMNPYGKIVKIKVPTVDFKDILPKIKTLVKMDIENVEGKVLLRTQKKNWKYIDAFVEIGDYTNAKKIFDYFKKISVNIFSHKKKWKKVKYIKDMPTTYKEGLVFISLKKKLPSML